MCILIIHFQFFHSTADTHINLKQRSSYAMCIDYLAHDCPRPKIQAILGIYQNNTIAISLCFLTSPLYLS